MSLNVLENTDSIISTHEVEILQPSTEGILNPSGFYLFHLKTCLEFINSTISMAVCLQTFNICALAFPE